ncbi:AraC family transcriptional regulator [Chitinophaga sedimenti]|uniref:helix-turn-helix transcriptional regulator n=1 Tax=Chitinophaga sedimenti TaxID=2033606 RepID=UPI0020035D93|nr:AraC family transcriptional regulator [Chitinophaga sedimenti]MCK7554621.1 AraC family transcriptional regulator [Chitinophaga sedimenti]
MNVLLIERADNLTVPAAQVPQYLVKHLIPYARTYFSGDEQGDLLELNIKAGPFSFWMHYISMRELATINPFSASHVLALHHWFGGNIPAKLRESNPMILGDNECNLFNILPEVHAAWPAIDSSLSMHVNVDPLKVKELASKHPAFGQLARLPLAQHSSIVNSRPYKIDEVRRETLNRIISCKYVHSAAYYYFRRNFLDMYLQFLKQLQNEPLPELPLDQRTRDRLSLLRMYIGNHPDADINVVNMAAKTQLSIETIGRGFEQLYNISFDDYLLQMRMYKAYDLLMQTSAGKSEVAHRVGYSSYMGFIRAFIKYFGCDPLSLRREQ